MTCATFRPGTRTYTVTELPLEPVGIGSGLTSTIAVYDDAATHGCGSSTFAMPSPSLSSSAFSGSLSPSPPTQPSSTDFGMPSLSASVTTVKVTVSVAEPCVLPGVVRVAVYWPAGQPPLGGCRSRIGPVPARVIPGPASDHCSCAPGSSPSAFRIDPRSAMSPYWSTVMPWRTFEIAATSGFSPLLTVSVPVAVKPERVNPSITTACSEQFAGASVES